MSALRPGVAAVALGAAGAVALLSLASPPAAAYPSMIRNSYTGCGECHTDPSGGGVLTEYGRGQGVILLSSVYSEHDADWEPPRSKDFLFGAIPLPEQLALQADIRALLIPQPGNVRVIGMQNDLRGSIDAGVFHANASLGWVSEGAEKAWITSNTGSGGNLVSREHWVGVEPVDDLYIRAGRLNLPFGIRSEEHILYARSFTGTDTNDSQQVGLDAVWQVGKVRAEVMGIAGNFQVSPDDYRERGYSGMVAWGPKSTAEVGLSSKLTHAATDIDTRVPRTRQYHEAFGRWSPLRSLALLGEAGVSVDQSPGADSALGTFGYLQADLEPVQGFHVKGTGELCDDDLADDAAMVGRGTLALQWFAVAHFDLRADAMYGTLYCTPGTDPSFMGLLQAHAYL